MHPTDTYAMTGIPELEFNDYDQSIYITVEEWGDIKLLSEEHIEDEREYFKRKLIGK